MAHLLMIRIDGVLSPCSYRPLKNHPAEAVAMKPKPKRITTVITIPIANVSMLPSWSCAVAVSVLLGCNGMADKTGLSGITLRLPLRN